MAIIDLNSDVGEAFGRWTLGDDEAIFRSVSSANVACGFHAGDPGVIRATCEKAVEAGVVIGAHVGYRDLAGFGRRFLDIDPKELADDVVYQIGALQALAAVSGARVEYVKPHGGLYNTIVKHTAQARAVVEAVKSVDPNLPILGLPGSEVLRLAEEAGLKAGVWVEALRMELSNSITDERAVAWLAWDLSPVAGYAQDDTEALVIARPRFTALLDAIAAGQVRDAFTVATALRAYHMARENVLPGWLAHVMLAPR